MGRPRKFDEATVLRAARDQFWRTGYTATSIDDLTAATGLRRASLYGAFGDKRTLFLRSLDDYCELVVHAARDELGPGADAYDRLVAHLNAAAARAASGEDINGCFLAKSAAELASSDDVVAGRVSHTITELHRALENCIIAAQREGSLAADADPSELASVLLALLRGLEALGKAHANPTIVEQAAERMVALLPRAQPPAS
jgi:TetR/AcrR family transcriptional regulator, transcriptional repressor for nem operon